MELKHILAKDDYFGSKAPVRRQRLFHLGRELKSGGRSLCNLGLGKFNNRILHLYIRPGVDGNEKGEKAIVGERAAAGSRKRNRATSQQQPTQECSRQRQMESNGFTELNAMQEGSLITSQQPHSITANSNSNNNNNNNIAIDLLDSSDDDEVEIIEVL